MGTDRRDRRWPRASEAPAGDDDLDTRRTNPVPILPLVVEEKLRPHKTFRNLAIALGLPLESVRALMLDVLDDPSALPEIMTASQLLAVRDPLLATMDAFVPETDRAAAHRRVEALLTVIARPEK